MKNAAINKIGIIGFGSIGERHYRNLTALGLTDITVWTKRTDVEVRTTASFKEFAEAGRYEAIFICNETYKHRSTIKQVLALKPKALFVEKPLAMTARDVRAIKKMLAAKNVHVFVGYSRQFYEPYQKIKSIVDSGKLGTIYEVRISVGQDLAAWRKRDYRKSYSSKKKQGGGVILDLIHEINFPAWLLGESFTVTSSLVRKVSSLKTDVEDLAETLGMTKKGTVISIHLDCVRRTARWSCEIIGSRGSLTWDSESKILSVQGDTVYSEGSDAVWNDMFIKETQFFLGLLSRKKVFSNLAEAEADAINIDRIKAYGR